MARGFETHARTVSALTLVSRVSGLARDAALARIFGVGVAMDAFAFAFMVPNLFRRLFGEGALASSFLPVYTRLDAQRPEVARPMAWLVLSRTAVMLAAMTLPAGTRVIEPGTKVTRDYRPDRLNIEIDAAGVIVRAAPRSSSDSLP